MLKQWCQKHILNWDDMPLGSRPAKTKTARTKAPVKQSWTLGDEAECPPARLREIDGEVGKCILAATAKRAAALRVVGLFQSRPLQLRRNGP